MEPIGALLTRLRLARGYSQLRVAERLCAVSGMPTVSRHEISRWERGERIPGRFWLGWFAVVLEAPLGELEAAAAASRQPPARPHPADHRLELPPDPATLLHALAHAPTGDLREQAHTWLTDPPDRPLAAAAGGDEALAAREARLADLRRMDDLLGGAGLARHVDRELTAAIRALPAAADPHRHRALRLVAELAQLAGWVRTDAADLPGARRAYQVAFRAATAAGDRALAAHVLGALSLHCLIAGDPPEALLLARTGLAGAAPVASAYTRALLLQRVALAAAKVGDRRASHAALTAAARVADRSQPDHEPSWLYWLNPAELTAMTGRCLVVLGRPLRAVRLLATPRTGATSRTGAGPRAASLYATWLARAYLDLGEVELACRFATRALRDAIRSGSARAASTLHHLHPRLLRYRDVPMVRGYEQRVAGAAGYLAGPAWRTPGGAEQRQPA